MLRKYLSAVCAVAFIAAVAPASSSAQDNNWNQRTYFTFSAPVELPGKTLPAGTYLFRVVDSPSSRHVIQVFDKDEKNIHATVLTIPAQRAEPADSPEVRFMEATANQPAPIRTWWFPGRAIGHEFIYPKDQATRLAKASRQPVLTVASDASTTEAMREAELARVNKSAETSTYSAEKTPGKVTGTAMAGRMASQTTEGTARARAAQAQPGPSTPPPAESERTTMPQSQAVTQRPVPAGDAGARDDHRACHYDPHRASANGDDPTAGRARWIRIAGRRRRASPAPPQIAAPLRGDGVKIPRPALM